MPIDLIKTMRLNTCILIANGIRTLPIFARNMSYSHHRRLTANETYQPLAHRQVEQKDSR